MSPRQSVHLVARNHRLRWYRVAALGALWAIASAHVGSSLTVQEGTAGPYGVRVLVRPPGVIPGRVEVVVRTTTPSAVPTSVSVRPALWRYGLKGAAPAEPATAVPGEPGTFSASVWIMAAGSYAFHVQASGPAGNGTLVVPVSSVATTASTLPSWMGWMLSAMAALLVLGFVSIVGAASREGALSGTAAPQPADTRRARKAMAIAVVLLGVMLTGGWKWWDAVDRDYRRRLDKPLAVETSITSGDPRTLTLTVTDPAWTTRDPTGAIVQSGTPLMPDHGKLMHLFLIEAGGKGAVAHVHPVRTNVSTFVTPLAGVPAGKYWLFAEVVRESGYTNALADTVDVPAGSSSPNADGDDAWTTLPAVASSSPATFGDGMRMAISIDGPLVVARDVTIRARVTNADGSAATLVPWLGMAGHAMVLRTDGKVFMHVHPMGTISMAAQARLLRREAGDTVLHGDKQPAMGDMPGMSIMSHLGDVSFPVAFPSAGEYRVFVQVRRHNGSIETAALDVIVPPEQGR
jgi:hypothetical protein